MPQYSSLRGFSLAEILITIAIMATIAAFTIPKFASGSIVNQSSQYSAIAKNSAFMVSSAYEVYRLQYGTIPSTLGIKDLTPYMNFTSLDSSGFTVDHIQTQSTKTCDSGNPCLHLYSKATLLYEQGIQFGGTATTNAVFFSIDPDGRVTDGTTNGPGKSVEFWLYYDGKIKSSADRRLNTIFSNGSSTFTLGGPSSSDVPPWFTGL